MRKNLPTEKVTPTAAQAIENFFPAVITEIETATKNNEWLIVGMAQNPVVKGAKKFLAEKNITFKYLEYGSYFSQWKLRLAIKLWSGWPTFPQVFHKGILVGGFDDLKVYLKSNH